MTLPARPLTIGWGNPPAASPPKALIPQIIVREGTPASLHIRRIRLGKLYAGWATEYGGFGLAIAWGDRWSWAVWL